MKENSKKSTDETNVDFNKLTLKIDKNEFYIPCMPLWYLLGEGCPYPKEWNKLFDELLEANDNEKEDHERY